MPNTPLTVSDVAYLSGETRLLTACGNLVIKMQKEPLTKVVVLEAFTIVDIMQQAIPNLDIQLMGPTQCYLYPTKKEAKSKILFVCVIWLLLFVGSAMAIMNFHYDVSMQSVQQRIHFLLTGENNAFPLWLQIPYSIGLGLGMILFFNHLFKKRFNEEPSPMEIEIYKYQQDIDQYVQYYENPLNQDTNDQP